MKKLLYLTMVTAAVITGLASCESNEPDPTPDPDAPTTSAGAYILCQGQYYNGVEGGLYAIDYNGGTISDDVFKAANGYTLGDTPQCAIAYGNKLYIGVYASNCIFIVDKNTNKVVKNIRLENSDKGKEPRSMAASEGKVYVSMYDGYVARLDTVSLEIDAAVKVGPNPEIIDLYGNNLYVPNSDGMNWESGVYGKTASVIDLKTFTVTSTIDVPENPYQFAHNETGLYLLSKGNYKDVASAIYKVDGNQCTQVAPATIMALGNNNVYYVNDPFYGAQPAEYKYYDGKGIHDWEIQKVDYPSNIAVDELGGKIFISSYIMDGQYPSYSAPGYVNEYDLNSKFLKKYNIGVGPTWFFFNHN